jgi:poly(3-hydroxybutyrate) depolymerase
VRDVQRLYAAEERYFLTGWEAGGHTVWPLIFQHPEALRAAAPAVTNWAGRCMEAGFSNSPARAELPVAIFQLAAGRDVAPGKFVVQQSQEARRLAEAHGYRRISERIVSNRPHGPLADEVLAWFQSLL